MMKEHSRRIKTVVGIALLAMLGNTALSAQTKIAGNPNGKCGLGWTSNSHTGLPVPVFALGVGQDAFAGYYDNTDIYKKVANITKVVKD